MVKRLLFAMLVVLLALSVSSSRAAAPVTTVIYEYTAVVSGYAPAGSPPWAILTITDVSGGVQFDLQAKLQGQYEFISKLLLNIDPFPTSGFPTSGSISGAATGTWAIAYNSFSGIGERFDMVVEFETANNPGRLTGNESVSWTISGLQASWFTARSEKQKGQSFEPGTWFTLLHVQGIGPNADQSGWLTVPEPGTLLLFGTGLAAPLLLRRRRN